MLKFYHEYEKEAAKIISHIFDNKTYIFGDNSDYDFKFNFNNILEMKFEVKTDNRMNKTGNVFIEYESNNKKSGIETTQSDYYIITDKVEYFLIEVILLKQLINDDKNILKIYNNKTNNRGYLLKKFILLNNSLNLKHYLKFVNEINNPLFILFTNLNQKYENEKIKYKNNIFELIDDDD